jgi:hypothetical protein
MKLVLAALLLGAVSACISVRIESPCEVGTLIDFGAVEIRTCRPHKPESFNAAPTIARR